MGNIAHARGHTVRSAQLLSLFRFRTHAAAPAFGPSISLYADMLDPESTDERRLAACRRLLCPLNHQIEHERCLADRAKMLRQPTRDPHGRELRTTQRGAVLREILRSLETAVAAFQANGVKG